MRDSGRQLRANALYGAVGTLGLVVGLYLFWAMRSLFLPAMFGALSAYICSPLIEKSRRWGIPRSVTLLVLLGGFVAGIAGLVVQARNFLADEQTMLVLRVRGQHKLNERYDQFKPVLPAWVSSETDPLMADINRVLALDKGEQRLFELYRKGYRGCAVTQEKYYRYHQQNLERMSAIQAAGGGDGGGPAAAAAARSAETGRAASDQKKSAIMSVVNTISIWLVMPFVFLFLLFDNGKILKALVSFVPNKYFEVTLTVFNSVDDALGKYLRGVTVECGLVGMVFFVCLMIIGIDPRVAFAIGFIAGIANAIPFLGPAIGLVVGVCYALVAEEIRPAIPFITPDTLIWGVLVTVAIAQGLDNAVFQPIVLGKAVDLHPLIVVFGVMGGSIVFGMIGMLLAVPAIMIVKVVVATTFQQMRAYRII